ncbi:hypothetical protein SAMN05519105_3576 [Rhodobacter sp. 24-YEA-8]|nr:hypothetical protein SAMN05519105_3576 [Rhodobacter sp. 24-YEA-8]
MMGRSNFTDGLRRDALARTTGRAIRSATFRTGLG